MYKSSTKHKDCSKNIRIYKIFDANKILRLYDFIKKGLFL